MRWCLVLTVYCSLGCAGLASTEPWPSADPAPGADGGGGAFEASSSTGPSGGSGGIAGEGNAGGSAGQADCDRQTVIYSVAADVALLPGSSDCAAGNEPTINYGLSPYINVGVGRAALRFALDEAAIAALYDGASIELEVTRSSDCDGAACPAAGGVVAAYPMRNDWREGTMSGQGVDGATWCEADPILDKRWDAAGASGAGDHGAMAGSVEMDAAQAVIGWQLAPPDPYWIDALANELSVLLVSDTAAVMVIATAENGAASAPVLRVSWCER